MLFILLLLTKLAESQSTFSCLSVCRLPYFTCIQNKIPGHEVERLQQCVIDARNNEEPHVMKLPDCVECVDNLKPETNFPTATVTEPPTLAPVTQEFCDGFSKRRKVCHNPDNTGGACHWDETASKCVPGALEDAQGDTLLPLDDLKPCLKICQSFALECNFNVGVSAEDYMNMRVCSYELAEEQLMKRYDENDEECKDCLGDVFGVIGNPLNPPAEGFGLFNDVKIWVSRQVTASRCKAVGAKFKRRKDVSKPGRCVLNKSRKLRCKRITRMDFCAAVGCNVKSKKDMRDKCNGKNKWM